MKKVLVTVLATLISQAAFAGDLFCGANIETVPGSQVYNKLLFWEKADATKPNIHYLLAGGILIDQKDLTPDSLAKIVDGTLALGITFTNGKPQVFTAKVKRVNDTIAFKDLAMAIAFDGTSPFLMANGAAIMCKEQ
jgi:hypothetical protein